MFDIDKIQIEAALKGKISDEEKLRLELQRAILNEDADLADKLQKKLEASQRATAALQGQINGIKPLADPFAAWLLTLEGIALTIEEEVLNFMVEKALEYKLGARGLRSICESILTDAMFELPGTGETELLVTLDYAENMFSKSKMSLLKVA
jgi:hypothetical protein